MFLTIQKGTFLKVLEWGLYIFIALFPFILYPGYVFNGTSTRAINLVIFVEIFAVALGALLLQKSSRFSVAKSPITIGLLSLLVVLFATSFFGVDFATSFWSKATRMSGLFYLLHLGIFYLFLMMVFRDEKKQRNFIKVFLFSTAIFSIGALLSKEGWGMLFASKPWAGFTFGNSTFAAMYLFAGFLLSIYYTLSLPQEKKVWWKYLLPVVFVLNPFIISQDALLGKVNLFQNPAGFIGSANATSLTVLFSVVLLFGFWLLSKIKSATFRRGVVRGSVILGFVGAYVVFHSLLSPDGALRDLYLKQATEARPILWSLSQKAIESRPVFGWGGDNFDRALNAYYDNRLLEDAKGGEGWFDRAHNIFIDQTVDSGYVGVAAYLLVYIAVFLSLVSVVLYARERKDQILAVILITYFGGHLLELQTAFETTISYVALVVMAALSATLYHKVRQQRVGQSGEWEVPLFVKYAFGIVLMGLFGALFFVGTVPLVRSQNAHGALAIAGTSTKRLPLYEKLFSSPLDEAALLHRIFFGLQEGISMKPSIIEDAKRREGFVKEFEGLVGYYSDYIAKNPEDYRAHLEFAELCIYIRLFDVDRLTQAHTILDEAISIVPQAPQAHWLKSVAYLYQGKFKDARESAKRAYDINPNIEESKRVVDYIDRSIRDFPEIDLFAFKKI